MKENAEIVLAALLAGIEVEHDGRIMFIDPDQKKLGWTFRPHDGLTEDDMICCINDMSVNEFIKMCDKMTFDKLFILSSETALTKMGREKAEERQRKMDERTPIQRR